MKKKLNLVWRMLAAVVLAFSIVSAAVATSGDTAQAAGPSVWMDQLPPYVSDDMMANQATFPLFSGTSLADGFRTVDDILIQIKYRESVHDAWLYWNGDTGAWVISDETYNRPGTITDKGLGIWGAQQDWEWDGTGTFNLLAASMTDGAEYTVTVWAVDSNVDKSAGHSRTFIYDETNPSGAAIVTIGDGSAATGWVATNINSINGYASDTVPGRVAYVGVLIADITSGVPPYPTWDGTSWIMGDPLWLPATLGTPNAAGQLQWSLTDSTTHRLPNWTHGHEYSVTVIVSDKAGNWQAVSPTQAFTYIKTPSSGLNIHMDTLPAFINNFGDFTGVARAAAGKTISDVKIKIYNGAAMYWNETDGAWQSGNPDLWNEADADDGTFDENIEEWTFDVTAVQATLTTGNTYTVWARAAEGLTTPAVTTQTFVADMLPPAGTSISNPVDSLMTGLGLTVFQGTQLDSAIRGSASDATGGAAAGRVSTVILQIADSSVPTYYWNGLIWVNTMGSPIHASAMDGSFDSAFEQWNITTGTIPPMPYWKHGHEYTMTARTYDGAGNEEVTAAGLEFIYIKDLTSGTPPATPTETTEPTGTPTATATATSTGEPTGTPTATTTATATATTTPGLSGSGSVGATGGTVTTTDGRVEVTFPAGAFSTATTVTIASAACSSGDGNFNVGSTCFSVTPSEALGADATICVKYSTADLNAAGGDTSNLTIGYYSGGEWYEASDVTVSGGVVCGKASHLSNWAVLSKTGDGDWAWWYYLIIGAGVFIVVLAIILLVVIPKKGAKEEEVPAEELYGEEEEEF